MTFAYDCGPNNPNIAFSCMMNDCIKPSFSKRQPHQSLNKDALMLA